MGIRMSVKISTALDPAFDIMCEVEMGRNRGISCLPVISAVRRVTSHVTQITEIFSVEKN